MDLPRCSAFLLLCGCVGGAAETPVPKLSLSMKTLGRAQGTVTATSGAETLFTCTSDTCSTQPANGAPLTLTATPGGPAWIFSGWSGDCAGAAPTCSLTASRPMNVVAQFRPAANFVFESSVALPMPFGASAIQSQAAADALCASRAAVGGLPGHYVAWLSTTGVNAIDKLGAANGWVRTDGLPFANTRADLAAGKVFYPPGLGENGNDVAGTNFLSTATGTGPDGTVLPAGTCNDWTSAAGQTTGIGVPSGGSKAWTAAPYSLPCSGPFPLYCFETSFDARAVPAATGRLAFVSKGVFAPGAGRTRGDADKMCQSEAAGAGLPPPFTAYLALLAVAGESPMARFPTAAGSAPWVRPDGVLVAAHAADLAGTGPTSTRLLAPIDVAADGTYVPGGFTWTGAVGGAGLPGDVTSTCNDWSSTANSGNGGQIEYTIHWADEYRNSLTCLGAEPVFCLQK